MRLSGNVLSGDRLSPLLNYETLLLRKMTLYILGKINQSKHFNLCLWKSQGVGFPDIFGTLRAEGEDISVQKSSSNRMIHLLIHRGTCKYTYYQRILAAPAMVIYIQLFTSMPPQESRQKDHASDPRSAHTP